MFKRSDQDSRRSVHIVVDGAAVEAREGDTVSDCADAVIPIPVTQDALMPLVTMVPMQLLAYYVARERGCEIDQPRNLAKSVTVE